MSTEIVCKFRIASIKRVKYHDSVPEQRVVEMSPVYGNSPENKAFFDSTPSGKLEFTTSNLPAIDGMDLSKEYYITIRAAE